LEDFQPPLDIVDGAARVMDPCLMVLTQENIGGKFLKDYNPIPVIYLDYFIKKILCAAVAAVDL
jgi:hypothetical protein